MKTILIPFIFSQLIYASTSIKGHIERDADKKYFIKTDYHALLISASESVLKSLESLRKPSFMSQADGLPYKFKFVGKQENENFILSQTPTLVAGNSEIRGVLKWDERSESFRVNHKRIVLGYTKKSNGYQFDESSLSWFKDKEVVIEGDELSEKEFKLQAIIPRNLLKPAVQKQKKPLGFALDEMTKNIETQSSAEKMVTLYDSNTRLSQGDGVLLITLSGRQGDSFGAVNGHFVAGIGELDENLELMGEFSNAYVTNDKDILSSPTSLTTYYGHLVQGQNQYRPTFTLAVYGIEKNKLKLFRDNLEKSHIELRTKKLSITPELNCTTETVKSLAEIGVVGEYDRVGNQVLDIITKPLRLFGEQGKTLNYVLGTDPANFHPRKAFESFVKTFLNVKTLKKLGVKKVDYLFMPQIPSQRPIGGTALGQILKANKFKKLYEKYEVNPDTKLSKEDLRPILEKTLNKIQ